MLVASEPQDKEVLQKVFADDFPDVVFCTDMDEALDRFVDKQPAVLLLVCETIEQAESFYLSLFRTREEAYKISHQSIVLCHQHEAYKRCKREVFDDYVTFRPLQDPYRLNLLILQALERRLFKQGTGARKILLSGHKEELEKLDHFFRSSVEEGRRIQEAVIHRQMTDEVKQGVTQIRDELVSGSMGKCVQVLDRQTAETHFNNLIETHVSARIKDEQAQSRVLDKWARRRIC